MASLFASLAAEVGEVAEAAAFDVVVAEAPGEASDVGESGAFADCESAMPAATVDLAAAADGFGAVKPEGEFSSLSKPADWLAAASGVGSLAFAGSRSGEAARIG